MSFQSSPESSGVSAADRTVASMKAAVEAGDIDGFMQTLAPTVQLNSPISMRVSFRGHERMRLLMQAVFSTIEDIRYYEDLGDDRSRALFYRARVGSQPLEEACLIRLDDDAKIIEFTLWIRAMPAITRLAATLGPALARRHGPLRAGLVSIAARPLAFLTSKADGPLVRLVKLDG